MMAGATDGAAPSSWTSYTISMLLMLLKKMLTELRESSCFFSD
jgi:hypothetical protein